MWVVMESFDGMLWAVPLSETWMKRVISPLVPVGETHHDCSDIFDKYIILCNYIMYYIMLSYIYIYIIVHHIYIIVYIYIHEYICQPLGNWDSHDMSWWWTSAWFFVGSRAITRATCQAMKVTLWLLTIAMEAMALIEIDGKNRT